MQVRRERRPRIDQLPGEVRERRIARHRGHVGARERMLLDRDEAQPAGTAVAPPRIPGREEVVAQAEAGFQHDEAIAPAPPVGQAVAREEDMPCLLQRARHRVVDVAIFRREGHPIANLNLSSTNRQSLHAKKAGPRAGSSISLEPPPGGGRGSAIAP